MPGFANGPRSSPELADPELQFAYGGPSRPRNGTTWAGALHAIDPIPKVSAQVDAWP